MFRMLMPMGRAVCRAGTGLAGRRAPSGLYAWSVGRHWVLPPMTVECVDKGHNHSCLSAGSQALHVADHRRLKPRSPAMEQNYYARHPQLELVRAARRQ
jgi:hypothetical protein